ncbi:MAG: UDP-N-acetylmuramate--L-alanine ligase [Flavobacteriales bacterium]|nr:UDP-N-acetylmuramate--L-alanine ligase [Flavobacteriales bacterium]
MNPLNFGNIVFLGIGGIGMSAIARFCRHSLKLRVVGYDKTPSELTEQLQNEGIPVVFEDDPGALPSLSILQTTDTLVIFTPAIPASSSLLSHFRNSGFQLMKRSEALGWITAGTFNLSVAGTHGKTTTTAILQHLLYTGNLRHVAFLGGISSNLNSNYYNDLSEVADTQLISLTEADEYDRSFLKLKPNLALITSMDPDHLDIYGDAQSMERSFNEFANCLVENGILVLQERLKDRIHTNRDLRTYGIGGGTYRAEALRIENGHYFYNFHAPGMDPIEIQTGLPGRHNVENAVGASAIYLLAGGDPSLLAEGLRSFRGVKRRFEFIRTSPFPFIDDYAHHPDELRAILGAVREMYPKRKITGIFQPHLYSRTRDFYKEFANSLRVLDRVILLDIYPAREEPIPGVRSEMIAALLDPGKSGVYSREDALDLLRNDTPEVLLTLGAGDIDRLVPQIKALFE